MRRKLIQFTIPFKFTQNDVDVRTIIDFKPCVLVVHRLALKEDATNSRRSDMQGDDPKCIQGFNQRADLRWEPYFFVFRDDVATE